MIDHDLKDSQPIKCFAIILSLRLRYEPSKFLAQSVVPVTNSYIRHISSLNIIAHDSLAHVVSADEMLLYLHDKAVVSNQTSVHEEYSEAVKVLSDNLPHVGNPT